MRRLPKSLLFLSLVFLAVVTAVAPPAQAAIKINEFPIPTAVSPPTAIAPGPDGNLWFTEAGHDGKIGRSTTGGSITEYVVGGGNLPWLSGITAGPDGNLWFTVPSSDPEEFPSYIGKMTLAGVITTYRVPSREYTYPLGITAGPDGALWFTDAGLIQRIGRITTEGVFTFYPLPSRTL